MTKRYRDGEKCSGCGVAGLTLDREGLCHGCWLATWERDAAAQDGERLGELRALDDGYEVPLPLSLARAQVVPVGPIEDLCTVAWGLTSQVLRGGRPVARWLF